MLGQEHSHIASSDMLSDRSIYSQFFAKEIERIRKLNHTHHNRMKLEEACQSPRSSMMGSSSQYCLRWNNHRNNLLAAFEQLLHVEAFTDVTLACEEGVTLHAHRLVLAACSSYFQALFVTACSSAHPIVVLKDVRGSDMRALLEYMYRGEVNVEHDHLQGLLRVAESLRIKGLVEELGTDARRASSPHDPLRPPTTSADGRPHQDLPRLSDPPSSTTSVSTHDRSSSPKIPPYVPPCLPSHRPPLRLDHRLDHRDHRDHSDMRELELRDHLRDHLRDPREGHEPRETHTPSSLDSDSRQPLSLVPPMAHLPPHCPDSPPHKRKRPHILSDPMLSPTPILRTALGHTHAFPGADMSSLVSLASSMMPLPGLLSSHVPHLLPHEHRDYLEAQYGVVPKKEHHDDETRPFTDISREDDQDHKMKLESLANGPLLPDINPYHLDPNGSSHFSNFVSYVPTPKPEWKRYKQYTKADLMDAIDAVKNGMTALQASRKYKVPSRTLYDKIKKMGISTLPRRLPNKKPSLPNTDLEGSATDPHPHPLPHPLPHHLTQPPHPPQETPEPPTQDREPHPQSDHEKRPIKIVSDEEDHSTQGPTTIEDEEESSVPTPAMGSFSFVGRKMYENGGPGETSATPLDLTDTDSLIGKRPEIEERA